MVSPWWVTVIWVNHLSNQRPRSTHSALHPSGVAKSGTSFGWGKGGNVTSAGWQVTLCDPIWYASSRSGDGRPACKLLYAPFTFTFTYTTTEQCEAVLTALVSALACEQFWEYEVAWLCRLRSSATRQMTRELAVQKISALHHASSTHSLNHKTLRRWRRRKTITRT